MESHEDAEHGGVFCPDEEEKRREEEERMKGGGDERRGGREGKEYSG